MLTKAVSGEILFDFGVWPKSWAFKPNFRAINIKSRDLEREGLGLFIYKEIIPARPLVLKLLKRKIESSKARDFWYSSLDLEGYNRAKPIACDTSQARLD